MMYLLLIVGFILLVKGADLFVDGSSSIAGILKVPSVIIGLTIVAIGTSTPELVVSAMSAINGSSDIAIGNVVGSNTFNVFIILGICTLITPLALSGSTIRRDIPIAVAASLILLAAVSDSYLGISEINKIGRLEGVIQLYDIKL